MMKLIKSKVSLRIERDSTDHHSALSWVPTSPRRCWGFSACWLPCALELESSSATLLLQWPLRSAFDCDCFFCDRLRHPIDPGSMPHLGLR